MALSVAAGTETLHGYSFGDVDASQDLIVGAQHHIYTVLSTIVYCVALGTAGTDEAVLCIVGHDHHAGADSNASAIKICTYLVGVKATFVWNDKFSFNGFGAAAYTEPLNTNAEQLIIAAQAGTLNRYQLQMTDADVDLDAHVTFIDQNNA